MESEICKECTHTINLDDLVITKNENNISQGVCPYCYNELPNLYSIYFDLKIDKEYKEMRLKIYGTFPDNNDWYGNIIILLMIICMIFLCIPIVVGILLI